MSTLEEIQAIVAEVLNVPQALVAADAQREQFPQWDSLRHLDLVMEVEARCGCSFTMEEMTLLNSVPALVELVQKKRTGGASPTAT
jgi:acyl carrier protein